MNLKEQIKSDLAVARGEGGDSKGYFHLFVLNREAEEVVEDLDEGLPIERLGLENIRATTSIALLKIFQYGCTEVD